MSSESGEAHEVPLPSTSTLPVPTTPPKRFLSSHTSSQRKLSALSPPQLISACSSLKTQPSSSQQIVTPPKLIRFPTVVLTPLDVIKLPVVKTEVRSPIVVGEPSSLISSLPPPPPLIKMPISTRKEKRAAVPANTTKNDGTESGEDTDKLQEPLRKRTRAGGDKSGESSGTSGGSTTPRKIIQEIFGPDKSKRPKGKGRKKRRAAPTPKKKLLLADERTDVQADENVEEEGDDDKEEGEQASASIELEDVEENEVKDEEEDVVDEIMPNLQEQDIKEEHGDNKSVDGENDEERISVNEEEENILEEDDSQLESAENKEETVPDDDNEGEDQNDDEVELEEEIAQIFPREASRRKAKLVANEKLKRLSKNEDGNVRTPQTSSSTGTPEDVEEEDEDNDDDDEEQEEEKEEDESEMQEEQRAASIHSRRSTTEGSSKSGSSITQADSESSGGGGPMYPHNHHADRQKYSPTPLSIISDDDDSGKEDEDDDGHHGNVSESDNQDQKDSDVDSTYSWKPVRAAAAAALEQVTKNQGNGSVGLPGDAETKAAAAAERRARKINRYKGRNRRTLMFKSSHSKRFTGIRNNRYSAQPTIAPKVYHHGQYFQAGDIVFVELADSTALHGQIKGLVMDHFGETSAGVRFLAPKHPLYALMDFEPVNYALRYDIPEKLIKIEFVNFVMHLNLDYFDGHPSFNKIEKNTVYTRMGKSIHSQHEFGDSDCSLLSDDISTSGESVHEENIKEEKKDVDDDDDDDDDNDADFLTDSSADIDDIEEKRDIDKVQEKCADANNDDIDENETPSVTSAGMNEEEVTN